MPVAAKAMWEVDALPLLVQLRDNPGARTVAVLVGANGLVLGVDLVTNPPSEPEDVATRFVAEVEKVVRATGGAWPRTLVVRHDVIVAPLARALALHGVRVRADAQLATIDAVAPSLQQHMGMGGVGATEPGSEENAAFDAAPTPLLFSAPESWHAWDLPPDTIAALFAAAARFHAARPWTHLYNGELLTLDVPDALVSPNAPSPNVLTPAAERWTACVLGNGGEQFGLALYATLADFFASIEGVGLLGASGGLQGPVLTLDLSPRRELPRPMQREIAAAGWPVNAPDAYPRLWALNTPAGGVTRAQAQVLTLALDAVARFTTAHEALLSGHPMPDPPLTWTDDESGIRVTYAGDVLPNDDEPSLWTVPATLTPGGAEGPNADLLAGLGDEPVDGAGRRVADDFRAWLATAPAPGGRGRRPGAATAARHAEFAELFVEFLTGYQGVTLPALHEFDLRAFLYDWFPRKVRTSRTHAMMVPAALRTVFRYLADRHGLVCPWADPVLADREVYAERWERFPGGFWWDEGVAEWHQALSRDFDARVFLPDPGLAGGGRWGETMGMDEARLHRELERRWLAWRDEEIGAGQTAPAAVRAALVARQRAWERAPNAEGGGRTPVETVKEERKQREPRAKRSGKGRGPRRG